MKRLRYLIVSLCIRHPLLSYAASPVCQQQACTEFTLKTWKDRRDMQVVKQDFDFSCGAAALATVLNGFYGISKTEQQILMDMNKEDGKASFADMANVVEKYGFSSNGVALNYETLTRLKVPVIVYLEHRKDSHFSVLKGISKTHVQLADPSWGNRLLSKDEFLAMWETRSDTQAKGKILIIQPVSQSVVMQSNFWQPPQPNELLTQKVFWRL